jgi:hypothetical protein
MDKQALQSVADTAAQQYLDDSTDPTAAVEKQAEKFGLTDEQTERVAHYTNQSINSALMEKNAYTDFPLADPEKIDRSASASEKVAFVPQVEDPQEKTASTESEKIHVSNGLFSKVADLYGASYQPSSDPERHGRSLLKAAEIVATEAMQDLKAHQRKLAESRKEMYEEVEKSIYEGTDPKTVIEGLEEKDVSKDIIEYILNRLEAEGMVPTSTYEDDGPYSEERRHLKSGRELKEDSPLAKAAEDVENYRKHVELDASSAILGMKVAKHAPEVAGTDSDAVHEKQAGVFTAVGKGLKNLFGGAAKMTGKGLKKGYEGLESAAKGIGKWTADDPLVRAPALGFGAYGAGQFAGDQKNDMSEPKQQFA